jgi:hypothetical protein
MLGCATLAQPERFDFKINYIQLMRNVKVNIEKMKK